MKEAKVRAQDGCVLDHLQGFPPKLYVIGAQKCGTTAFCDLLAGALPIGLSTPKEPGFFTRNYAMGYAWYRTCFDTSDRVLMDGTPGYTMADDDAGDTNPHNLAAQRIRYDVPDARLIYVVRDPVRRAWAGYWHAVRSGDERADPLDALDGSSQYIRASKYWFQLSRYLSLFDREQILCVDHSYFADAPEAVVKGVGRWLDLPVPDRLILPKRRLNASYRYNTLGKIVRDAVPAPALKAVSQLMKSRLPASSVRWLRNQISAPLPDIDEVAWRQIADLVATDYAQFRRECADRFLDHRIPAALPSEPA